jgi:hypothetical protein
MGLLQSSTSRSSMNQKRGQSKGFFQVWPTPEKRYDCYQATVRTVTEMQEPGEFRISEVGFGTFYQDYPNQDRLM